MKCCYDKEVSCDVGGEDCGAGFKNKNECDNTDSYELIRRAKEIGRMP